MEIRNKRQTKNWLDYSFFNHEQRRTRALIPREQGARCGYGTRLFSMAWMVVNVDV